MVEPLSCEYARYTSLKAIGGYVKFCTRLATGAPLSGASVGLTAKNGGKLRIIRNFYALYDIAGMPCRHFLAVGWAKWCARWLCVSANTTLPTRKSDRKLLSSLPDHESKKQDRKSEEGRKKTECAPISSWSECVCPKRWKATAIILSILFNVKFVQTCQNNYYKFLMRIFNIRVCGSGTYHIQG